MKWMDQLWAALRPKPKPIPAHQAALKHADQVLDRAVSELRRLEHKRPRGRST